MEIKVNVPSGCYSIFLEKGNIHNINSLINTNRKAIIISDSGVPKKYIKTVENSVKEAFTFIIKQGENSKSFKQYEKICKFMLKNSFDRNDCVIAVGGGVVGDLAGFVASTYMRGVDFYNIPTTLLSQVDSSIGGKVAVNFAGYKNIIGAFYQPRAVIIDPNVLSTLPKRQISNGLAESLKMALTSDKELFELLENANIDENIETIIERSLRIKKYVVENDEKENGLRKILNFGHTIGHAIESSVNLKNWYHGECVAAGMLLTCSSTIKERVIAVLEKLELPTHIECDKKKMISALNHDKKKNGDYITEIFVDVVGEYIMKDLSFEELSNLIETRYC